MTIQTILRYDVQEIVTTPLDPFSDVVSWIGGLRSQRYVKDVLEKHHPIDPGAIKTAAERITSYAENAHGLIQQAYAGPPHLSFLPLYYAMLNLSKIYIVAAGYLDSLDNEEDQSHGVKYKLQSNDEMLTGETIKVFSKGTFALLYKAITKDRPQAEGMPLKLREIYPYIRAIAYEYKVATGITSELQSFSLNLESDPANGFHLTCEMFQTIRVYEGNLDSFQALDLNKFALRNSQKKTIYDSLHTQAEEEKSALQELEQQVKLKRYLIYLPEYRPQYKPEYRTQYRPQETPEKICRSPLSKNTLLQFPEEIPLWLAFYHLSSVVRYYPERLDKYIDSEYWAMLLALHRHGLYRFLILFWSYFHQKTFIITTGSI